MTLIAPVGDETTTITVPRAYLDAVWGELIDNDWLWSQWPEAQQSIGDALYGKDEDDDQRDAGRDQ